MKLRQESIRWAVLIRCKDGRQFLACGTDAPVKTFRKRDEAVAYKKELFENRVSSLRRMKAVKVKVKFETV